MSSPNRPSPLGSLGRCPAGCDLGAVLTIARGRTQWSVTVCRYTATDLKIPLLNRSAPSVFRKRSYVLGAAVDAALKAASCNDHVARAGAPSFFDERVERFLEETRASILMRTLPVVGARPGEVRLGWYVRIDPYVTIEQPNGLRYLLRSVVDAAIEVAMERA